MKSNMSLTEKSNQAFAKPKILYVFAPIIIGGALLYFGNKYLQNPPEGSRFSNSLETKTEQIEQVEKGECFRGDENKYVKILK